MLYHLLLNIGSDRASELMVPGLQFCNSKCLVLRALNQFSLSLLKWRHRQFNLQRRLGHATLDKMLELLWQSDAPQQVCIARIGAKDIQMRVCAEVKGQKA
jgi:hypothetical protein